MQPGFHESSGLFLAPCGLRLDRVPHAPTRAQIDGAKSLIYELVEDFPFVAEADRTNAIIFGMLPYGAGTSSPAPPRYTSSRNRIPDRGPRSLCKPFTIPQSADERP